MSAYFSKLNIEYFTLDILSLHFRLCLTPSVLLPHPLLSTSSVLSCSVLFSSVLFCPVLLCSLIFSFPLFFLNYPFLITSTLLLICSFLFSWFTLLYHLFFILSLSLSLSLSFSLSLSLPLSLSLSISLSSKKRPSVGVREIVYVPPFVQLNPEESPDCYMDDDHFCRFVPLSVCVLIWESERDWNREG